MRKKELKNWPVVAICYDFDKTLSPKDMQEYTLFPKLGISAHDFWKESNEFAESNGMDKMLSYMKLIVKKAADKEDTLSLTKKDFPELGKGVELFDGLDTWFDRINQYANGNELKVEHYIISAGLKEIIEGTSIAKHFKEIYASCFYYNANYVPIWPKQVVNATQKTQYLFRINKNCLDLSDEESLNKSVPDELRRVPFRNFIYLGDSMTDIPAMKVIKNQKGISIGVYNPKSQNPKRAYELFVDERIDFFAPADYSEGSPLELYVKKSIDRIKANEVISRINSEQETLTSFLSHINRITEFFKEQVDKASTADELENTKKGASGLFINAKKEIAANYKGDCFASDDAIKIVIDYKNQIDISVKNKKKELFVKSRPIIADKPSTGGAS